MRILVTGGAGFIGSHYVRTLVAGGGPAVTVLDKLTYAGDLANLDPVRGRFTFVRGDVCDADLVAGLVAEHDEVVHFAAESHVDRSIADASEFVRTNVTGTQTPLEAAIRGGLKSFVHVSTDEVYGSIAEGSWPETHPPRPSPLRGVEGGRRPARLPPHPRPGRAGDPPLQRLRASPLPREDHPVVRHQPARREEGPAVRRRAQRPRPAPRRRPRAGRRAGAYGGPPRRRSPTSGAARSRATGS